MHPKKKRRKKKTLREMNIKMYEENENGKIVNRFT